MDKKLNNLLKYGVRQDLANELLSKNLNIKTLKATSIKNLVDKYLLDEVVAKEVKKLVERKPIAESVLNELLVNNNFTCCCCLGNKGKTILVHHIEEFEKSQDNSYVNLAVLCPICHDLVHSTRALTLTISKEQLVISKQTWEESCVSKRKHPEIVGMIQPLIESWSGNFNIHQDDICLRYSFDLGLYITEKEITGNFTLTYLNRGNIFMAGEFSHEKKGEDADIAMSYWGMQWGMRVSEKKTFNAIINYCFANEIHIINLSPENEMIPYDLVLQRNN
jgi:hypothetical protein